MRHQFLLLLLCFSYFSKAQIGGLGTYKFLDSPVSARETALGGLGIAVSDNDANLSLNNPAILKKEMNRHLNLSYINYFSDINYGYASFIKHIDSVGTFSGGLKFASYGEFTHTDASGYELGTFSAGDYILVLGYGRQIDSNFSVGLNFKPVFSSLYTYWSVGAAIDLSAMYYNKSREFVATFALKNIGHQIKPYTKNNTEPLPFQIVAGISKIPAHIPVRLSAVFHHLQRPELRYTDSTLIEDNAFKSAFEEVKDPKGTFMNNVFRHIILSSEFLVTDNIHLRLGYNFQRRNEMAIANTSGFTGFSWGFGFKIKKFQISYGSATYHVAGATNNFTISTNLSEFTQHK